jgi:hypothetical protein
MSQEDFSNVHIESSIPKSWEVERTFNDVLYEWMASAPWLAISAAVHGVIILIMIMIPWEYFNPPKSKIIQASVEQAPEDAFEDPPPPEEPEEIEKEKTEEPVIKDAESPTTTKRTPTRTSSPCRVTPTRWRTRPSTPRPSTTSSASAAAPVASSAGASAAART